MKLAPQALIKQLAGGKPLASPLLVVGDEPQQRLDALQAIRSRVREQGGERVVLEVARGFDWNELAMAQGSGSLFASLQLIELKLSSMKLGKPGGAAMLQAVERCDPADVLLVTCDDYDAKALNTAWAKRIGSLGALVECRRLAPPRYQQWLAERAATLGLKLEPDVAALIVERNLGNMVAGAQELAKLSLLYPAQTVGFAEARATISDGARFDVFELVDTAFSGQLEQTMRMLDGLIAEGHEPPLTTWAVLRDLRLVTGFAEALETGRPLNAIGKGAPLWPSRRDALTRAAGRAPAATWQQLLVAGSRVERAVKGALRADPWVELRWLFAAIAVPSRASMCAMDRSKRDSAAL